MFSFGLNLTHAIAKAIAGRDSLSRNFTELTAALGTYWKFKNTLVFGAGDTIAFGFLAPTAALAGTQYLLDGDSAADRVYFGFQSDGLYLVNSSEISALNIDGVDVPLSTTSYPTDGKLHKAVLTLKVGARLMVMGSSTLSQAYDGVLLDVTVNISGVTTSFTLGNDVGEDTEYSALGAETWSSLNFSGAGISPWTGSFGTNSGNFIVSVVGNRSGPRTPSGVLISGKTYRLRVHATVITGGFDLWYLEGINSKILVSLAELNAGAQVVEFTSNSLAQLYFRSNVSGVCTAVLHSISVEEVLGNTLTRVNVPDVSIEKFQLSADETQWDNISPLPQELQSVIEVFA